MFVAKKITLLRQKREKGLMHWNMDTYLCKYYNHPIGALRESEIISKLISISLLNCNFIWVTTTAITNFTGVFLGSFHEQIEWVGGAYKFESA